VLPYGESADEVFRELKQKKIRVGTMDLRIGATAIANGMIVLTRNTVDFERIPDLQFEDWTTPVY
jgi:tRNA(fMet)-specific endonuclease VapC